MCVCVVNFCSAVHLLHYLAVIGVIFCYYTASVHDVGNCNMVKSAAESRENVGEFHNAWRMVYAGM